MAEPLFGGRSDIPVKAFGLGERIDLRLLEATSSLGRAPLVVRAGRDGCAAIFRYGAVVLFGLTPSEEAAFLTDIGKLVQDAFPKIESDGLELRVDPAAADEGLSKDVLTLKQVEIERLQIVAESLAKSVALSHYETVVAETYQLIEPLADGLRREGRVNRAAPELLRRIGDSLIIEHKMVHRIEIDDKPELLWDRPDLERIYVRLENEFELGDRCLSVERKLNLNSKTVETVINLLQHEGSIRVEWYIVFLIILEIMLTLYTLFIRPQH